jgi:hypothetical protein
VKRLISVPLVLILVAGVAACGDDEPTSAVADGGDSTPDGLVVRVDRTGGFVPVDVAFTDTPEVSIYGDGRVLTPGAMIEIYPGPAYVPLQQTSLDDNAIAALVAKAEELGLAGEPLDYGQPPVADAPDTVVTIVTDEGTFEQRANALAEGVDAAPDAMTDEQRQNREKLLELVQAIDDAAASSMAADGSSYEPEAYRVHAEAGEPPAADPSSPEPQARLVEWPVELLAPAQIGSASARPSTPTPPTPSRSSSPRPTS